MTDFRVVAYSLLDAQARAKEFPETFSVPSLEEINELKSGSIVKICLTFDPITNHNLPFPNPIEAERVWVEVVQISSVDGKIVSLDTKLENESIFVKNISLGTPIKIAPENILTIFGEI